MIKEVSGDILNSKANAIVHGVSPMDNFHKGLALSLRERWPSMYKDFRHFCQIQHPKSGELWTWQGVGNIKIISLFTQVAPKNSGDNPGRATLENVNHCLRSLKKEIGKLELSSIAITKLATGVGGLDWENVKPLIEEHLASLDIPVYIYSSYHANVTAKEE